MDCGHTMPLRKGSARLCLIACHSSNKNGATDNAYLAHTPSTPETILFECTYAGNCSSAHIRARQSKRSIMAR
eukprot:6214594-Pleurochrysis_carterae.AAC.2